MARSLGWMMVCLLVSATAIAQPHLQQEQVNLDTSQTFALGGSSDQKLAQTFNLTRSGFISHLTFAMNCQPVATVRIRIEETTAGVPNGSVVESLDVPGTVFTSLPTPAVGFRLVEFPHPVRVSSGIDYAITLEAIGGDCGMYVGPAGSSYPGGRAYFDARPNPPGWIEFFGDDGAFRDLAFQVFTVSRRSGK